MGRETWAVQNVYHYPRIKRIFKPGSKELMPEVENAIKEKSKRIFESSDTEYPIELSRYGGKSLENPLTLLYRKINRLANSGKKRIKPLNFYEKSEYFVRHRYLEWAKSILPICLSHVNESGIVGIKADPEFYNLENDDCILSSVETTMQMLNVSELEPILLPYKGHRGFLTYRTPETYNLNLRSQKFFNYYEVMVDGIPESICFKTASNICVVRVINSFVKYNASHIIVRTPLNVNHKEMISDLSSSASEFICLHKKGAPKRIPNLHHKVLGEDLCFANEDGKYTAIPPWLKESFGCSRIPLLVYLRSISFPKIGDNQSILHVTKHLDPDPSIEMVLELLQTSNPSENSSYLDQYPPRNRRKKEASHSVRFFDDNNPNLKDLKKFSSINQLENIDMKTIQEFCKSKIKI